MSHPVGSELPFILMSAVVAVFGSWTALDLFRRATAAAAKQRAVWVAGAAVAQGLSIWSMHFVAMLGWSPGVPVRYDPGLTAISLLLPILACGGAFRLAVSGHLGGLNRPLTALGLGGAICAMHYVGMAALRSAVHVDYDPWIVLLSFLIAVGAAYFAIWAAGAAIVHLARAVSAIALGLGIVAMHYTGMAAMQVTILPSAHAPERGLDQFPLAMAVGAATLALLVMAAIAAIFDRRLERANEREAAAMRSNEQFLRALVDQMPVGVVVVEAPSGRLRQANAEAARLLGHAIPPHESWREYNLLGGIDPDGEPLDAARYPLARAVIDGERTEREVLQYRRGDGKMRLLEVTAGPIRDADGSTRFAVATFTDVTEQRAAEEALRQGQRMEAIGQLTGGVAHDFNNLLTAVTGSLSLAAKRVQDEPTRALLDNATHAARRGASLVAQLLAFSRRQRLEQRPVDVSGLVRNMAPLLISTLGGSIRISFDCEPGPLFALADPTQLELAVLNLAINARDSMSGGGALVISTGRQPVEARTAANEPPPGDYVAVSVEDTGTGIPEQALARVFDPFFTTKPVGKGSGLGLSQVLGLAQQMGGGVKVVSALGKGSKFTVFLPPAVAEPAQPPVEPDAEPRPERSAHGRVLVLDDDDDVRRFIETALEDAGFEVVATASAGDAVERVKAGLRPDRLVIDYAMPEVNGEAAARALREAGVSAQPLFITGYSDLEALKGQEVLMKPFEAQDLVRRVEQLDGCDR
jgi:PAS domain S-box-containing protein